MNEEEKMKPLSHRIFQILIFVFAISFLASFSYADTIRVWSFNMDGSHHQRSTTDDYRSFLNSGLKAGSYPDFIATQENFGTTQVGLIYALNSIKSPTHDYEQYGRSKGGPNLSSETNAIIYNKYRFTLIPEIISIENDLAAMGQGCDQYTNTNNLTCQLDPGHDGNYRIITWGIFQERSNNKNIVIFTSTQNALSTAEDQQNQQKRTAIIINKLIERVKYFYPGVVPTVVMAGDYNTDKFNGLYDNLDPLTQGSWSSNLYTVMPTTIFVNAAVLGKIDYHSDDPNIANHGPIAETITLNPIPLK